MPLNTYSFINSCAFATINRYSFVFSWYNVYRHSGDNELRLDLALDFILSRALLIWYSERVYLYSEHITLPTSNAQQDGSLNHTFLTYHSKEAVYQIPQE